MLKTKNIHWLETDLINDLIVKGSTIFTLNLPYIPTEQYKKLDKSVLNFEPRLALDGGSSGLVLYERFFKQLISKKINTKYIILETEESIYKDTIDLSKQYFKNTDISELQDVYGRKRFLLISFL
jgi:release factor glutamine methyltransferase